MLRFMGSKRVGHNWATELNWTEYINRVSQVALVVKNPSTIQFSSVTQSCLILCHPTDWSMPSLPVHHRLLELAQTHVHWVGDTIQLSHPLSSPSPPAFNLSPNQGLFQWVSSLHKVTKVLEFQLQHPSFQWIFRIDFLYNWPFWSPCWPRDSQ